MPRGSASARLSVSQNAPAVLQPLEQKKKKKQNENLQPLKKPFCEEPKGSAGVNEQHFHFKHTENVLAHSKDMHNYIAGDPPPHKFVFNINSGKSQTKHYAFSYFILHVPELAITYP